MAVDSCLHKMPCVDQNAFVLRLAGFRPRSTGVRRRTTTTTRTMSTSRRATTATTIRTTMSLSVVSGVLSKAKSQSAQVFHKACATLLESITVWNTARHWNPYSMPILTAARTSATP